MLLSIILALIVIISFFVLKSKTWDKMSHFTQTATSIFAALILSSLFVMEFFIYIDDRILRFLSAIEGIPTLIVLLVFAFVLIFLYKVVRIVGDFDLKSLLSQYRKVYHEVLKPEFIEVKKKVREKYNLNPLKWFRKIPDDTVDGQSVIDGSKKQEVEKS